MTYHTGGNINAQLHRDKEAKVFVDAESFKIIVEQLGYTPANLVVNPFIPKGQAIILNDERKS